MRIFNAHVHLNGSISLEYLKDTAKRNGRIDLYNSFVAEPDLWKKFGWIHKIIQTAEDVKLATIDVVKHSKADALEIRTTPKMIGTEGINAYVQAFIAGLEDANKAYPGKRARGLLSIDRSSHSLDDAKRIVDIALTEKQKSGMIVGVDLSGNFLGNRTLTGNDLYQAVKYALHKDIGVALHVGETDSEFERQDFDIILNAIEEYKQTPHSKIYGKVRLGHAIYRTAEQDQKIRTLKIPVEICPTCHQILDWWKKDQPHPILSLYKHRTQVIAGTDDNLLFGCNDEQEQQTLDSILTVPAKYSHLSEAEQHEMVAAKRMRYMF